MDPITKKPVPPKPKIVEEPESETPMDPLDTTKIEEIKQSMTPVQKEEFSKKIVEAVEQKKPLKYNFKYNPAGFMTIPSEVKSTSPFGKPMKMQKMEVAEKLVLDEPPPPGPLKKSSKQLQMVKPGKVLGTSTEIKD